MLNDGSSEIAHESFAMPFFAAEMVKFFTVSH
jgi:hypothetical protein